jgi:hypothetical protein
MPFSRRTFLRTAAITGVGLPFLAGDVFSEATPRPVRLIHLANYDVPALKKLLQRDDYDALVVNLPAKHRFTVATAAMKAGKCTAFTGPVGQTVGQVQQLLTIHQQTGTPCLLLDADPSRSEILTVTRQVQEGHFGKLTYVRCGTDSPTNGLAVALEWLGINRGNRFMSLNAALSRSWGLHEPHPIVPTQKNAPNIKQYELGEVLTVNLQCANGQTVVVHQDLKGKRPYERGLRVQGTNGSWTHDFDEQPTESDPTTSLVNLLQQGPVPSVLTQDALTVSLIYAVAKASIHAWQSNIEIPNWFV